MITFFTPIQLSLSQVPLKSPTVFISPPQSPFFSPSIYKVRAASKQELILLNVILLIFQYLPNRVFS